MSAQTVIQAASRAKAQASGPADIDTIKRLLTVEQVGKQLQVSRYTIWRLCRDRKFPSPVQVGSRRRWRQVDIDAWTAEQRS
jgi:excisionase family DNA binding protein